MPQPAPRPLKPNTAFGPWSAHINALEHGYEIVLVRTNTDRPNNRERVVDPYPCFTEWGALRRARRLTRSRNRAQARINAKQEHLDRLQAGIHLSQGLADGLLDPYLNDAVTRATKPAHIDPKDPA